MNYKSGSGSIKEIEWWKLKKNKLNGYKRWLKGSSGQNHLHSVPHEVEKDAIKFNDATNTCKKTCFSFFYLVFFLSYD